MKTILSLAIVTILAIGLFPTNIPAAEAVGLKVEPKTVAPGTSITVTIEPNTFSGQTVFAFISANGFAGAQNNTALFNGQPQILPNDVGSEENVIVPTIPDILPGTYWVKLFDGSIWRVSPSIVVIETGAPTYLLVDNKNLATRGAASGTPARYLDGLGWRVGGFVPAENLALSATGSLDILITEDEDGDDTFGEANDVVIDSKGSRSSRGGRSIVVLNGTAGTHVLIGEGSTSQLRASASIIIQPSINVTMPRALSAQGEGVGYTPSYGFNRFDQTTFSAAIFENKTVGFWLEGHGWDASVTLNSASLFSNVTGDIIGTLAPDKTIMKETNSKGYFGTFYSSTLTNYPTDGLFYVTMSMGGLSTRSPLFILAAHTGTAAQGACTTCPAILATVKLATTAGPIGVVQAAFEDRWVGHSRFLAYAFGFDKDTDIKLDMASGALVVGSVIAIASTGGLGDTDKRGAFLTYRKTNSNGDTVVVGNTVGTTLATAGVSIPWGTLVKVNTGQNSSETVKLNLVVAGTKGGAAVQVQADKQYRVIPTILAQQVPNKKSRQQSCTQRRVCNHGDR